MKIHFVGKINMLTTGVISLIFIALVLLPNVTYGQLVESAGACQPGMNTEQSRAANAKRLGDMAKKKCALKAFIDNDVAQTEPRAQACKKWESSDFVPASCKVTVTCKAKKGESCIALARDIAALTARLASMETSKDTLEDEIEKILTKFNAKNKSRIDKTDKALKGATEDVKKSETAYTEAEENEKNKNAAYRLAANAADEAKKAADRSKNLINDLRAQANDPTETAIQRSAAAEGLNEALSKSPGIIQNAKNTARKAERLKSTDTKNKQKAGRDANNEYDKAKAAVDEIDARRAAALGGRERLLERMNNDIETVIDELAALQARSESAFVCTTTTIYKGSSITWKSKNICPPPAPVEPVAEQGAINFQILPQLKPGAIYTGDNACIPI